MQTVPNSDERAFSFKTLNQRERKPRSCGITEIRGPYYTPARSLSWKLCAQGFGEPRAFGAVW
jgi:hypothetical protein